MAATRYTPKKKSSPPRMHLRHETPRGKKLLRRSLFQLISTLYLTTSNPVSNAIAADTTARKRETILILGAGLAGLAAARELVRLGHDVVILEGRDRIGGRLWTSTKWTDLPLDLGASWIHGTEGNPLTDLARQAKAVTLETSYDRSVLYNTDGRELADDTEALFERLSKQFHDSLRAAQNQDSDQSVRQVIRRLAARLKNDPESVRLLNFLVSSQIEQEYAGSAERLSAHWYDNAESFDGADVIFAQGYRVIVELLSKELLIKTGQVVREIHWHEEPVRVVTSEAEFTADKLLITLPLGVLKSGAVKFNPPLPASKQKAISTLEMGVLNKCYLKFAEPFWPKEVDWLEYIPEKHGEWTEWVSLLRVTGQPVLLGFNAGARGREIEAWTDQQIVTSAMQPLRKIFGNKIPEPIDYQITRWSSDPLACGSYSFNPVGATPSMRELLAEPLDDVLYFAGEATDSDYFGTAHGAYLSGVRAAAELHAQ